MSQDPPTPPLPPQPGTVWARIELAREALGWKEGEMGERALGNRTHYSSIKARGWSVRTATLEKIISRLQEEGFSEAWLRAGVLPARASGLALPERGKVVSQLNSLAGKLALSPDQVLALWADSDERGPLQNYPEALQRAAFAAAYLENRTLEDVREAVELARATSEWTGSGVDQMLADIRIALRGMKTSGGTKLPPRAAPKKPSAGR